MKTYTKEDIYNISFINPETRETGKTISKKINQNPEYISTYFTGKTFSGYIAYKIEEIVSNLNTGKFVEEKYFSSIEDKFFFLATNV